MNYSMKKAWDKIKIGNRELLLFRSSHAIFFEAVIIFIELSSIVTTI